MYIEDMMNLKFGFFKDSLEKFRDQDCKDSRLKRKNEFVTYFFFSSFFFVFDPPTCPRYHSR